MSATSTNANPGHSPQSANHGAWRTVLAAFAFGAVMLSAAASYAQAPTPFGDFNHDTTQPVNIEADNFRVENATNKGVLSGNVLVQQGTMRLACQTLEIYYSSKSSASKAARSGSLIGGGDAVDRIIAIGRVLLSDGQGQAATAKKADYDVAGAKITLTGNVTLLRPTGALKGPKMRIDLASGTAQVITDPAAGDGRVRVLIQPPKK